MSRSPTPHSSAWADAGRIRGTGRCWRNLQACLDDISDPATSLEFLLERSS